MLVKYCAKLPIKSTSKFMLEKNYALYIANSIHDTDVTTKLSVSSFR